jgi:hypothetical protein
MQNITIYRVSRSGEQNPFASYTLNRDIFLNAEGFVIKDKGGISCSTNRNAHKQVY